MKYDDLSKKEKCILAEYLKELDYEHGGRSKVKTESSVGKCWNLPNQIDKHH